MLSSESDQIALETAKRIENAFAKEYAGDRSQRLAVVQCLIRDAINSELLLAQVDRLETLVRNHVAKREAEIERLLRQDKGVAERERERCARVCDGLAEFWGVTAEGHAFQRAAAAIRKGGE